MFTSSYKLRSIPNLRTGLNNRYDSSEIADTDMSDCENVEVDVRSIRSAGGYVDYGGDTGPFYGGFHAVFSDGTNRLIRQRGAILEYDSDGAGTWVACTLPTDGSPAETVTLTETACSIAMLGDTVMWSNGTDTTMSSADGITWALEAALPKAQVLFNNGLNRLLYIAQPASPSKVEWSDVNDPTTVGASAYQYINPNDGQGIEDAVLMPNGGMLLFKTFSFYQISDITFDMTAVDPIGEAPCVRHTAAATENSAIWAGPDGKIYEFDGAKANVISDQIDRLNITKPTTMRGVYYKNKYRLAVPNGSDAYNSYEYVVNRQVNTENRLNPYVITKNQRYIGCYIFEDREVNDVRRVRLYMGDSRVDAEGSPAEVPGVFAYINDEHDTGVTQGLNGVAQDCYFTTKFFTEDVAFFIKRYTKFFSQVKSSADQTLTLSYRSDPFVQWTDVDFELTSDDIDFVFGDGSTGGFSEGYSFSYEVTDSGFVDLERAGTDVRGIQLKISWSAINDVEILGLAYKFLIKNNFH